jgi:hypothetical protein
LRFARVPAPLGMTDTAFAVPTDKLKRVAQPKMEPSYDYAEKCAFQGGGEGLTAATRGLPEM